MSKDQGQTVMRIMNQIDGVNLHEKHGSKFKFQMHVTPAMSSTPIEELDLNVRVTTAWNGLDLTRSEMLWMQYHPERI
jgi:hypothetical protein